MIAIKPQSQSMLGNRFFLRSAHNPEGRQALNICRSWKRRGRILPASSARLRAEQMDARKAATFFKCKSAIFAKLMAHRVQGQFNLAYTESGPRIGRPSASPCSRIGQIRHRVGLLCRAIVTESARPDLFNQPPQHGHFLMHMVKVRNKLQRAGWRHFHGNALQFFRWLSGRKSGCRHRR